MRNNKDCIDQVKSRLLETGLATEEEMKALEKEVRAHVSGRGGRGFRGQAAVACGRSSFFPLLWFHSSPRSSHVTIFSPFPPPPHIFYFANTRRLLPRWRLPAQGTCPPWRPSTLISSSTRSPSTSACLTGWSPRSPPREGRRTLIHTFSPPSARWVFSAHSV